MPPPRLLRGRALVMAMGETNRANLIIRIGASEIRRESADVIVMVAAIATETATGTTTVGVAIDVT